MPQQVKPAGLVFISYRRQDSADFAGLIYDRLVESFGTDALVRDINSISLGVDFRQYLESLINRCTLVLVVIGPSWATATSPSGKRRIDDTQDFVRIELESALRHQIPLIPVLVNGATMPSKDELPGTLGAIAYRNAVEISTTRSQEDMAHLIEIIKENFLRASPPSPPKSQRSESSESKVTAEVSSKLKSRKTRMGSRSGGTHPRGNRPASAQSFDTVVAMTSRADILRKQGLLEKALDAYDELIEQYPDVVTPLTGRADVLRAMGRLDEALAAYDDVIRRFPENVVAKNGRAQVLESQGRLDEALAAFDEIVRQHPDDAPAKNGRAYLLRSLHRYDEALAAFNDLIRRNPRDTVAKLGRAEVLTAQSQYDEARATLDEVIRQNPDDVMAKTRLAEILDSQASHGDQQTLVDIGANTEAGVPPPAATGDPFLSAESAETKRATEVESQVTSTSTGSIFRPTFASFESDLVPFDLTALKRPLVDSLGVEGYASHLAQLIAARETPLPLSLGLFGEWGSGKSYFLRLLHQQVDGLTQNPSEAFCRKIVQIHFNAWHYLDTNLWANLVCEIFDQLFSALNDRPDTSTEMVEALKKRLGEQSALAAEAREALSAAEAARTIAEDAVRLSEDARRKQERTVAAFIDDLKQIVLNDELRKQLGQVSTEFGLDRVKESFDELESRAIEVRTIGGRVKAMALALVTGPGRWRQIALLVAALAIPIALGLILPSLLRLKDSDLSGTIRALTQAVALICTMTAWISTQVRRGAKAVNQLEGVYEKVKVAREQKRNETRVSQEEKKLDQCLKQEEDARHALREADSKLRAIESELKELAPGRRLFRFLEDRSRAADYRQHLGLVSLVRRDFEQLSRLLRESEEFKHGDQPMLDRIVLYIDDLDRCRAERVVQVLEAVHLLLAFPLFAVVVAVDPRWLRRSLLDYYPNLIGAGVEAGDQRTNETRGRLASPQDYLEKIFQVPFHLQPLERKGFEDLTTKLFAIPLLATQIPISPSQPLRSTADSIPLRGEGHIESNSEPAGSGGAATVSILTPAKGTAVTPPPSPERLRLESWEVSAVMLCHSLFRTPRAVKRLANTYCLIRVGVEANEWEAFLGTAEKPGSHRIPLLMLSVSAAFPSIARLWLDALASGLIKEWRPNEIELPYVVGNEATATAKAEWDELRIGLNQMKAAEFATPVPSEISFWVPKVERYSF
jgi:tetratricopeptide (TPR) repeat protein